MSRFQKRRLPSGLDQSPPAGNDDDHEGGDGGGHDVVPPRMGTPEYQMVNDASLRGLSPRHDISIVKFSTTAPMKSKRFQELQAVLTQMSPSGRVMSLGSTGSTPESVRVVPDTNTGEGSSRTSSGGSGTKKTYGRSRFEPMRREVDPRADGSPGRLTVAEELGFVGLEALEGRSRSRDASMEEEEEPRPPDENVVVQDEEERSSIQRSHSMPSPPWTPGKTRTVSTRFGTPAQRARFAEMRRQREEEEELEKQPQQEDEAALSPSRHVATYTSPTAPGLASRPLDTTPNRSIGVVSSSTPVPPSSGSTTHSRTPPPKPPLTPMRSTRFHDSPQTKLAKMVYDIQASLAEARRGFEAMEDRLAGAVRDTEAMDERLARLEDDYYGGKADGQDSGEVAQDRDHESDRAQNEGERSSTDDDRPSSSETSPSKRVRFYDEDDGSDSRSADDSDDEDDNDEVSSMQREEQVSGRILDAADPFQGGRGGKGGRKLRSSLKASARSITNGDDDSGGVVAAEIEQIWTILGDMAALPVGAPDGGKGFELSIRIPMPIRVLLGTLMALTFTQLTMVLFPTATTTTTTANFDHARAAADCRHAYAHW